MGFSNEMCIEQLIFRKTLQVHLEHDSKTAFFLGTIMNLCRSPFLEEMNCRIDQLLAVMEMSEEQSVRNICRFGDLDGVDGDKTVYRE